MTKLTRDQRRYHKNIKCHHRGRMCARWRNARHFWEDLGDRPEGLGLRVKHQPLGLVPGNVYWGPPVGPPTRPAQRYMYGDEALTVESGRTGPVLAGARFTIGSGRAGPSTKHWDSTPSCRRQRRPAAKSNPDPALAGFAQAGHGASYFHSGGTALKVTFKPLENSGPRRVYVNPAVFFQIQQDSRGYTVDLNLQIIGRRVDVADPSSLDVVLTALEQLADLANPNSKHIKRRKHG